MSADDFIRVSDDPRHEDPIFHAGYVKGLRAAVYFLRTMADSLGHFAANKRKLRSEMVQGMSKALEALADGAAERKGPDRQ